MNLEIADFEHGSLRWTQFNEGRLACRHLYHRASDAPNVGGRPVAAQTPVDHLRGHVLERAYAGAMVTNLNFGEWQMN